MKEVDQFNLQRLVFKAFAQKKAPFCNAEEGEARYTAFIAHNSKVT